MDVLARIDGDQRAAEDPDPCDLVGKGIVVAEGLADGCGRAGGIADLVVVYLGDHAVDPVLARVEVVEAELIVYEYEYDDAARNAQGEAGHIDKGISFVASEVPPCYFEIILNHR
jgi:hypothetical protein